MAAVVTGGLGGLGLIASRELCVAGGAEKVVAVSRSGRFQSGPLEEQIVDTLQEYAVHQVIRCDLSDSASVTDAFKFADGGQGLPPDRRPPASLEPIQEASSELRKVEEDFHRSAGTVGGSLDMFPKLGATIRCLRYALDKGIADQVGSRRMSAAISLRDNLAQVVADGKHDFKTKVVASRFVDRLREYEEQLAELSQLITLLGSACTENSARPLATAAAETVAGRPRPRADFGQVPAGHAEHEEWHKPAEWEAESGVPPRWVWRRKRRERQHAALLEAMAVEMGQPTCGGRSGGSRASAQRSDGRRGDCAEQLAAEVARSGAARLAHGLGKLRPNVDEQVDVDGVLRDSGAPRCSRAHADARSSRSAGDSDGTTDAGTSLSERRGAFTATLAIAERYIEASNSAQALANFSDRKDFAAAAAWVAGRRSPTIDVAASPASSSPPPAPASSVSAPSAPTSAASSAPSRVEARKARLEAERLAYENPRCPKGHSLLPFTVDAGFPCDACHGEAQEGATMWGCRAKDEMCCRLCDYDVCTPCKDEAVRQELRREAKRREREEFERLNREHHAQKVAEAATEARSAAGAGSAMGRMASARA